MAGVTSADIECPVCHDDFTNPKLLPCNHLACRDCVLSWLQTGGGQGGCPLCRAPILSSTQQGQGQLTNMVDSLRTDSATAALVESHKVLTGQHCKNHSKRPVELFCSVHQELICRLCDSTNHRSCPEVKAITDVAREKRTELTQQSQRLKEKAAGLTKQMKVTKEEFKGMHKKVNCVFDDLQQCGEKRRRQVHDLVQKEEVLAVTSLAEMDKARAAGKERFVAELLKQRKICC